MENMVNFASLFGGVYKNKKVLITGHTGFKGSWLTFWLKNLGANVYGYSLAPAYKPNHSDLLECNITEKHLDIRDYNEFEKFIFQTQPEVVFHLAAQALVRKSYEEPIETYTTNVIGTLNLLDICRKVKSVKAIVIITSDKCYENKEWIWGYRENDPMGGYDPYSSSKGCAEILTASYRNSFFNINDYGKKHNILLASARAGNVIGGGDWAEDRLIPDIIKAASENKTSLIRNPIATRPWQHVLEPLSGYLTLGWKLLEGNTDFAEGWNFGPDLNSNITVDEVVKAAQKYWDKIEINYGKEANYAHEAHLLMLDCSKANKLLKWEPVWDIDASIFNTINWYKNYYELKNIISQQQINQYVIDAVKKKIIWTT